MKKLNKILGVWIILKGFLLAFGPFYIFKVCEANEKIMKCYWSSRAEIAFGVIGVFIGILIILSKQKETKLFLYIIELINCLASISIPKYLIGGCSSDMMNCQAITFPSIYLLNTITIIIVIILFIFELRLKAGVNK